MSGVVGKVLAGVVCLGHGVLLANATIPKKAENFKFLEKYLRLVSLAVAVTLLALVPVKHMVKKKGSRSAKMTVLEVGVSCSHVILSLICLLMFEGKIPSYLESTEMGFCSFSFGMYFFLFLKEIFGLFSVVTIVGGYTVLKGLVNKMIGE